MLGRLATLGTTLGTTLACLAVLTLPACAQVRQQESYDSTVALLSGSDLPVHLVFSNKSRAACHTSLTAYHG